MEETNETRLYVGNIPFQTSKESLKELFSQAGEVLDVFIVRNKINKKSRGFGFVSMAPKDAEKAVEMFNGSEFDGRSLQVNIARPRERYEGE